MVLCGPALVVGLMGLGLLVSPTSSSDIDPLVPPASLAARSPADTACDTYPGREAAAIDLFHRRTEELQQRQHSA